MRRRSSGSELEKRVNPGRAEKAQGAFGPSPAAAGEAKVSRPPAAPRQDSHGAATWQVAAPGSAGQELALRLPLPGAVRRLLVLNPAPLPRGLLTRLLTYRSPRLGRGRGKRGLLGNGSLEPRG